MGLLFLLALLGGSPILALIIFGSMWLDASAKDDRDREIRRFNIEESRHRDMMRRSCEIETTVHDRMDSLEDTVCSAITKSSSALMEGMRGKTPARKRRRTRSVLRYTDGTVEGREVITEITR